uniref:Glycosyl transferase 48 domain-containing protein n=1 Tax=Eutreptiella gymnastica TaxID=73025 RepID=A0A7S1N8C0_9EUGL
MGANSIRLWSWNYMGTTVGNHADFLDLCWNNGQTPLRVFLPFDMGALGPDGQLIYKDLGNAQTRRAVVSDWATLIDQYWRHPAIMGWLIGNELDVAFGGYLNELFSLANLMIDVAKEVTKGKVQLITMPLSETSFLRLVKKYYAVMQFDFWSLQTYDRYTKTPEDYVNATYDKRNPDVVLKPIVVTEFGSSSIQVSKDEKGKRIQFSNESMQVEQLLSFVNRVENFTHIIAGYSVMEWVDEWWKTATDFKNPNCPNHRSDLHTFCAHYVNSGDDLVIAIHEEWLGIWTQTLPEKSRSTVSYCIQPKLAYFALAEIWNGSSVHGERCAIDKYPDPVVYMLGPMLVALLFELAYVLYFRFTMWKSGGKGTGGRLLSVSKRPSSSKLDLTAMDDDAELGHKSEDPLKDAMPRDAMAEFFDVQARVAAAFEPYQPRSAPDGESTDIYQFAIKRLTTAVWDNLTSYNPTANLTFEEIVDRCIRVVYIKMMEGYYIWYQGGEPTDRLITAKGVGHPEPGTGDAMLQDLALYEIIRQYSGTINHCPEKVYEVFYFTKNYMEILRGPALDTMRRNLHVLLLEVFRIIFTYIDQKLTLDDINQNSMAFHNHPLQLQDSDAVSADEVQMVRDSLNRNDKDYKVMCKAVQTTRAIVEPQVSSFTGAFFTWIDPQMSRKLTGDEADQASKPKHLAPGEKEPLISRTPTNRLLYGSESLTGHPGALGQEDAPPPKEEETVIRVESAFRVPDMKRTFPQRGGFPTTFFNIGWAIRMILWIGIGAWYFQPSYPYTPVCIKDARAWLAVLDAVLGLVLEAFHWRMFMQRLIGMRHIIGAAYRMGLALWVYAAFLDYFGGKKLLPSLPNFALIPGAKSQPMDPFLLYLMIVFCVGLYFEAVNFARTHTYVLPGRLFKYSKKFFEGAAFGGSISLLIALIWTWQFEMSAQWSAITVAMMTLLGALAVAIPYSAMFGQQEKTMREARFLMHNWFFWGAIWAMTFFVFYYFIVPVVIKVRPDTLCTCPDEKVALTKELQKRCKFGSYLLCTVGVIMVWLSVIVINLVWVFACFQGMLLLYGIGRGKRDRVGNVKNWTDVQKYFFQIKTGCFPALSLCLTSKHNQMIMWNWFINSMYNEWLISASERDNLKITFRPLEKNETVKWELDEVEKGIKYSNPLFLKAPKNEDAQRRIIYFLWSLQAIAARERSDETITKDPDQAAWRASNRVLAMPSLTIMTPCAAEPVIYSIAELVTNFHANNPNTGREPRIAVMEYCTCTYPDEWENFWQYLKIKLKEDPSRGDLELTKLNHHQFLHALLAGDLRIMSSAFIVLQCRLWASYHGQTLVRLVRGVMNWRQGLELLATLENAALPETSQLDDSQLQQLLCTKFQFVICHQIYKSKNGAAQTKDVEIMFNQKLLGLHKWDLVYPKDTNRYTSIMRRWTDEVEYMIERPGPLRPNEPFPTEPKAENQNHAIPFVNGQVIGVLDMNQSATVEDSWKIPFCLSKYFAPTPATLHKAFGSPDLHADAVICPYRVVGYGEFQYTRGLSMVGEVAGQAEFCFTSIHQRVCRWPLRARLHYGHPDLMDGYWVRTRGGLSHASYMVNTAEDVFAGYEVVGRGERVEYIEWLQCQKGKESAIVPAFLFEKKLAQAAAQQMRSRDIYWLNQKSSIFLKFGLFFGTYGFYIYNTLMAVSIHLYIIAIVFFMLSGVTNHDLGVNQSSLAVPWLFQVGFLFSFPLIVEMSIQKGMAYGIMHFLKTLPFALVYHVFQLQTKGAFFIEGLVRGKGGYIASARGFGLDRLSFVDIYCAFATSHVHPGINLLGWVTLYSIYSDQTWAEVFLRCLFMVLVVICWVGCPIIFNPFPSFDALMFDISEMLQWLRNPLPTTKDIAFLLFEDLKRKDVSKAANKTSRPEITTKSLQNWVASQRPVSWMAWYMNEALLGPWGDEEVWFSIVGLLFQKSILSFLSYSPWLFWSYWACPSIGYSLWFAAPVFLGLLFFFILDNYLPHLQEYFNILKLYVPFFAICSTIYFILAKRIKFSEVMFYLLFYVVVFAMCLDFAISMWNFSAKFTNWARRTKFSGMRFVTRKRTAQHEDSIWFHRLALPRPMICIQKFYPVMALVLFTIMSSIIALGSYTMTALLYSPGVAKAAERASKRASKPDFTMSDVEKLIQERLAGMADAPSSPARTPKKRN